MNEESSGDVGDGLSVSRSSDDSSLPHTQAASANATNPNLMPVLEEDSHESEDEQSGGGGGGGGGGAGTGLTSPLAVTPLPLSPHSDDSSDQEHSIWTEDHASQLQQWRQEKVVELIEKHHKSPRQLPSSSTAAATPPTANSNNGQSAWPSPPKPSGASGSHERPSLASDGAPPAAAKHPNISLFQPGSRASSSSAAAGVQDGQPQPVKIRRGQWWNTARETELPLSPQSLRHLANQSTLATMSNVLRATVKFKKARRNSLPFPTARASEAAAAAVAPPTLQLRQRPRSSSLDLSVYGDLPDGLSQLLQQEMNQKIEGMLAAKKLPTPRVASAGAAAQVANRAGGFRNATTNGTLRASGQPPQRRGGRVAAPPSARRSIRKGFSFRRTTSFRSTTGAVVEVDDDDATNGKAGSGGGTGADDGVPEPANVFEFGRGAAGDDGTGKAKITFEEGIALKKLEADLKGDALYSGMESDEEVDDNGIHVFKVGFQRNAVHDEGGIIPLVLLELVPGGSVERYLQLVHDPLFRSRTVRVCERCCELYSEQKHKKLTESTLVCVPFFVCYTFSVLC